MLHTLFPQSNGCRQDPHYHGRQASCWHAPTVRGCFLLWLRAATHAQQAPGSREGTRPRRLLHTVFKRAAAKSDTVFTIMLTYVELYNNKVRDLLAPVSKPKHGQSRVELPRVTMHEVRGRVRLSGTETLRVPISNLDEALNLLRQYVGSVCCHILPGVEASPVQLCPIAAATRTAPWGAQT